MNLLCWATETDACVTDGAEVTFVLMVFDDGCRLAWCRRCGWAREIGADPGALCRCAAVCSLT